ncbi:ABC transporter ATP-binding protein [Actinomadura bangladeshensis]|uniref:dipeptide ABC transporter ATP-binding protein n=1 Tax=Actinomadura bangladeshensis TaxID=453573 RepID=UPI001404D38E|nr:ABC transporter ATP-binding protein [Actinomadura bangladeshensis]
MTVLEVTDLAVGHAGGVRAVRGVSFEVGAGEVLGVVGESGAGKTALALAVMGLLPDGAGVTGSVRLRGEELIGRSDAELSRVRGRDLAMVFQESALTPVHTVAGQIAEAVRAHSSVTRAAARARAVELLDLVGIPAGRVRAYPHEFSGGMRQRVMIAMAIANRPGVILADEPTAGLDVTVQAQVLDVLRAAKDATGAAIVLITHDLRMLDGFADRVMVLREGRAVETGPAGRVCRELRSISRLGGKEASKPRPERPVVLRVDGLARHYPVFQGTLPRRRRGSVRAVDGVAFDVREGETLALVGESGCGKTTTLMEILRLSQPQRGRVAVLGQDTASLSAARRKVLRRDVQVVFQDPVASLNPRMRVDDIIAEPLTAHGRPSSLTGSRVRELLELVGLGTDHARRYPHALSGGQRQRVAIARALALEPRLLLLDEPVSALDASTQSSIIALLESLQDRLGLAYLLVVHDLALVHRIAGRIAVMHMGRIVELGPTRDVYQAPAHPYTHALLHRAPLQGEPPDPMSPLAGCRFRSRCPRYVTLARQDARLCDEQDPAPSKDLDRSVACHHPRIGARATQ